MAETNEKFTSIITLGGLNTYHTKLTTSVLDPIRTSVSDAVTTASSASSVASEANTTAASAVSIANTASSVASEAKTTAEGAVATASSASAVAIEAKTTAASAVTTANSASTVAGEAKTTAASAVSIANTAANNIITLTSNINTLTSDINTLKGDGAGSIKDTVTAAVAAIVDSAESDFDTLREVADWIGSHKNDAAALQTSVSNLEKAVVFADNDAIEDLFN